MSNLLQGLLSTLTKKSSSPKISRSKSSTSRSKQSRSKSTNPPIVSSQVKEARETANQIINLAKEEAEKIRRQAKEDIRSIRQSLQDLSDKLKSQQDLLLHKEEELERKSQQLERQRQEINQAKDEIVKLKQQQLEKLEKIAQLSRKQAEKILLDALEKKLSQEYAQEIRAFENRFREEVDQKAKEILVDAMYHGATDYVAEYTVSTVAIKNEEIKGRIIGKDGRNIRAFEKVTGVDLDMDETPGEVRLSSFDPVRREIARVALERLIKDGRIQPTRIEEYVARAKRDIDKIIFEEGKKLCHAVGAYQVPRDLMMYLGRFKYRTSYGQNMIAHTLEETKIGMKLAEEVGADVEVVRMGCLFHDIGKVVDEEGSHVELGVKLLKKYNIDQRVIDTVAQHHEDEEFSAVESVLVYIADAISGARPGARYENYEEYVKRLKGLEDIAKRHSGVKDAYAIQAGREIRVIVDPQKISDADIVKLAHDIKTEIKETMTYPGTVTVNVIRETRATEIAK